MRCEYCNGIGRHDTRCPKESQPKATCYCSYCNEGIYEGEKYIENDNGEFRHYECCYDMRDLLEWLGYKIKTMDDDYN